MTLPKIPDGKDYSEATWRAGLDEAVRRTPNTTLGGWDTFSIYHQCSTTTLSSIQAHATTLLDAGIVKPVVSEAEAMLMELSRIINDCPIEVEPWECPAAIAVIQSALDKARAGE